MVRAFFIRSLFQGFLGSTLDALGMMTLWIGVLNGVDSFFILVFVLTSKAVISDLSYANEEE
jgi:hypothetical protein